jgi:hypothetical protein
VPVNRSCVILDAVITLPTRIVLFIANKENTIQEYGLNITIKSATYYEKKKRKITCWKFKILQLGIERLHNRKRRMEQLTYRMQIGLSSSLSNQSTVSTSGIYTELICGSSIADFASLRGQYNSS